MSNTTQAGTHRESAAIYRLWEKLASGEAEGHYYVDLLGLRTYDTAKLLKRIRKGLSYSSWKRFQRNVALSNHDVETLVQISPRTLQRRKIQGRFNPDESDRLLRAARVFVKTLELFEGDSELARQWLTKPQPALGSSTPLDYAETELGTREVESLIGRLEYGIPS